MEDNFGRRSGTSGTRPAVSSEPRLGVGNLIGTPMVGSADEFIERYGPAAASSVVAALPQWREYVRPNAPSLGLIGARKYPYAFVSDLVRAMAKSVRAPDEDLYIRQIAAAGIDRSMSTTMRTLLRLSKPKAYADHAQETWSAFHDTGRVIATVTGNEYIARVTDWQHHEVVVCKISLEVRRRIFEKIGLKLVLARREKCVAWGHDACVNLFRWD